MVFTNKYTDILMKKFKDFAESKSLKEEIKYTSGNYITIHTVFNGLTSYMIDELIKKYEQVTEKELAIYQFVEESLNLYENFPEGTDESDFANAACTCFLENLINAASWERINYDRFVPYLGEKSKEFCRAWDEFTGVKTPGLWSEECEK